LLIERKAFEKFTKVESVIIREKVKIENRRHKLK
jgi:hypothetical protein